MTSQKPLLQTDRKSREDISCISINIAPQAAANDAKQLSRDEM